jgi:nitric oxide reductase subunit B
LFGYFGGREYWAFSPILAIPILISWIFLIINFFISIKDFELESSISNKGTVKMVWPVYIWMWAVGIVFFFLTFTEAYLWLIPYFRENIIGELTVQWKAYGALVGSWNMLVYGLAIYVMEKTSNTRISLKPITYSLFFLGFLNLLLGWSHHIYLLPAAKWVRLVGYAISMTELIVLAKIIWDWKGLINQGKKHIDSISYRFLLASDFWIVINLILAILISIPAINIFTHGTHITVAHAMGSTIGINSMILFAAIFYMISENRKEEFNKAQLKLIYRGFWITNISLVIFWVSLIFSGVLKSYYTFQNLSFQQIISNLHSYFEVFAISGLALFIGIIMIIIPLISKISNKQRL